MLIVIKPAKSDQFIRFLYSHFQLREIFHISDIDNQYYPNLLHTGKTVGFEQS